MKNLIAGLLFVGLAWTAVAEPVEPAPTAPAPVVTTTTSTPVAQPASPVLEDQSKARPDAVPAVKTEAGPAAEAIVGKEKPRKKKAPLEIKWIDF